MVPGNKKMRRYRQKNLRSQWPSGVKTPTFIVDCHPHRHGRDTSIAYPYSPSLGLFGTERKRLYLYSWWWCLEVKKWIVTVKKIIEYVISVTKTPTLINDCHPHRHVSDASLAYPCSPSPGLCRVAWWRCRHIFWFLWHRLKLKNYFWWKYRNRPETPACCFHCREVYTQPILMKTDSLRSIVQ